MVKEDYYILNILRGLSALFVIFYHFFVYFFAHPITSANLLNVEPVELPEPFYMPFINDFPINIGHFGVSFFFLISGFLLIPSLNRHPSLKDFLNHKIFRLWPSFAICFAMGLGFVAVFYLLRGQPFPYTLGHVLSYFFWVGDIFDYPYIDGAIWTLEIQIKFYIFGALIWSVWKRNVLDKMCLFAVVLSVVIYGLYSFTWGEDVSWFYLVTLARRNLKYFMLILLGTCLYAYYKKQISLSKFLFLCGVLLACFLSPLFYMSDVPKTIAYLLGFFSFAYFVLFHAKSMKPKGAISKSINWVSEISYPLYIGHVLPGYTLMYFMIENGLSVFWGIFIALAYVFPMSSLIHKKIETTFIKTGNRVFSYFKKKQN